jgi:gliding motility-associated-like protein
MKPLFFLLLPLSQLQAQTALLSGTINQYAAVREVAPSGEYYRITDQEKFTACDLVMIIQMQGAEVRISQDSSFGEILDYGKAGRYTFAEVDRIHEDTVFWKSPVAETFEVEGKVQLVKVPVYEQAKVKGRLTCPPWNGQTGGVLALICREDLTLEAMIDAGGGGFRGQPEEAGGDPCEVPEFYLPQGSVLGAPKGEGIAVAEEWYRNGRGAIANGGGGGNAHNEGGGGGSHYGRGGEGGKAWELCNPPKTGGRGGYPLLTEPGRLFIGGAGGNGHPNNGVGTAGSPGGGIVFIRAEEIIGNGRLISAKGKDQVLPSGNDGGGGGGAGGTIWLQTGTVSGPLLLDVRGGHGSDVNDDNCHGPGAGGGGGIAWLTTASLPPGITLWAEGGEPGQMIFPDVPCYLDHYGATAGMPGTIELASPVPLPPLPEPAQMDIQPTYNEPICLGDELKLEVYYPLEFEYVWTGPQGFIAEGPAVSLLNISEENTGAYTVTLRDEDCRLTIASIEVDILDPPARPELGPDTTLCAGQKLEINLADSLADSFLWQDGIDSPDYEIGEEGLYEVTLINTCGKNSTRIEVAVEECTELCPLYAPNAFSPNLDGKNDRFLIHSPCEITSLRLEIYNRWGEQIRVLENRGFWDGRANEEIVPQAVYLWRAIGKFRNDYGKLLDFEKRGTIMVLR